MTSNLENRLQRIEALAPVGRNKMFWVNSSEDARAQHVEKLASGEIVAGDTVVWCYFVVDEAGEDDWSSASSAVRSRKAEW